MNVLTSTGSSSSVSCEFEFKCFLLIYLIQHPKNDIYKFPITLVCSSDVIALEPRTSELKNVRTIS